MNLCDQGGGSLSVGPTRSPKLIGGLLIHPLKLPVFCHDYDLFLQRQVDYGVTITKSMIAGYQIRSEILYQKINYIQERMKIEEHRLS